MAAVHLSLSGASIMWLCAKFESVLAPTSGAAPMPCEYMESRRREGRERGERKRYDNEGALQDVRVIHVSVEDLSSV